MELNESLTHLLKDEPPGYRPPTFAADLRAAADLYSTGEVDALLDAKTNDVDFQAAVAAINAELAIKAPINSPVFTGSPQAPTPATPSNDAQIATTAFVLAKINSIYTAADVLTKLLTVDGAGSGLDADKLGGVASASYALLASPAFTGTPTAPTTSTADISLKLANTQLVSDKITLAFATNFTPTEILNKLKTVDGTGSGLDTDFFRGLAPSAFATPGDLTAYAPLASPALTGTPTAPTASAATNTTQIATTAFVQASYAKIASPAFTGTPTAPTAAGGTNTTQLATTAFTQNAIQILLGSANSWTSNNSFPAGIDFGSGVAASATDLSRHIDLHSGVYGFSVTSGGHVNYNTGGDHVWYVSGVEVARLGPAGAFTLAAPLAVTQGGTGQTTITGIRTALGLAAIATSGSAADLIAGTVADARLPTSMAGKTFTSPPTISGTEPALLLSESDTTTAARMVLSGGDLYIQSGAPGSGTATSSGDIVFSGYNTADVATFTVRFAGANQTIWHAGNDGAGSGLDADLLDGQQGSYYLNAANLTGTVPDARLPTTMAGKTFSSVVTGQGGFVSAQTSSIGIFTDSDPQGAIPFGYEAIQMAATQNFRIYFGATEKLTLSNAGTLSVNGSTVWTAGNDGASSGLDSDLLDGQHGSFYQSASNLNAGTLPSARLTGAYTGVTDFTMSGQLTVTNAAPIIRLQDTTASAYDGRLRLDANNLYVDGSSDGTTYAEVLRFELDTKIGYMNQLFLGSTGEAIRVNAPTAGNDPYISFYVAGVRTGYIQYADGAGTAVGFKLHNDVATGGDTQLILTNDGGVAGLRYAVGASNYEVFHSGNLTTTDIGAVPTGRTITAGNGMTGGGDLSANRTLTLGTPSNITNSTTNSVSATSHTHALGFTAAEVYTGSGDADTALPLGHIVMVFRVGGAVARNDVIAPCISTIDTVFYRTVGQASAGTALSGTYRSSGAQNVASDAWVLARRVA